MHKDITFEFKVRERLYQKYVTEGLNGYQIAELCHCHFRTIYQRLGMFHIPRRKGGVDHWSDEQKEYRRQWNKAHIDIISGMKGKRHSVETRRKMSLARQGAKNANWGGGLTELVKGIRRSPEFYQWRKAVLKRDNHTCRDCGVTGKVDAHHIRSIIDYPDGIFKVENGLVLCEDCHKRHTSWQRLQRGKESKTLTLQV